MSHPHHFFVYGTLKRGQCRQDNWPVDPIEIREAWTFGTLYDTGPFPALRPGTDRVAGEVWSFAAENVDHVMRVLDRIEGTNQPGEANEYDRIVAPVHLLSGESLNASLYVFAIETLIPRFEYLPPKLAWGDHDFAIWPKDANWPEAND